MTINIAVLKLKCMYVGVCMGVYVGVCMIIRTPMVIVVPSNGTVNSILCFGHPLYYR